MPCLKSIYTLGSYMYIYVHTSKYIRFRVPVICDDGLPSAETRLERELATPPYIYVAREQSSNCLETKKQKPFVFFCRRLHLFDYLHTGTAARAYIYTGSGLLNHKLVILVVVVQCSDEQQQ